MASSSSDSEVLAERMGNVGQITLNRPRQLNALTLSMCRRLREVLQKWTADAELRCIILKGAGPKAFCAGGDIKSLAVDDPTFTPGRPGSMRADFFLEEYRLDYDFGAITLAGGPLQQVSLWDGVVMGGGVGVSMHGVYRVTTEKTLWAMPETGIGLFPDVGMSHVLSRMPAGLGMYIGLTGCRLKAEDVLYAGLATHYIPSDRLPEVEQAIVDAGGDGLLELLAANASPLDTKSCSLAQHRQDIGRCFANKPSVEDIKVALRQVGAESEWARKTLDTLDKASPTSLKVTHRLISEGSSRSLRDCLAMEFRAMQRMVAGPDFKEGVRAVLVDRDNKPKWQPQRLEAVSLDMVAAHFATLDAPELLSRM